MLQARENLMEAIQAFLKKYDQIPAKENSMALLLAEERFLKIKQAVEEEQNQPENIQELLLKLINDLQILNEIQLKQEEKPLSIQEKLNQQKMYELLQMMQSFCEKLLQQKQAASIDQSPLQEMSIQDMEDLKQRYLDEILSLSNDLQIKDYRNEKIDIRFRRECESMIDELKGKFNGMSIEINKKKELQHLEQVANLSTYPSQRFKSFCYDDDDDYDYEESTIPLNEIISQLPQSISITPVLLTMEPEDSLIMGNKELSTIPEKESDEFIKSSVEDLVPIPSESEDTSESDKFIISYLLKFGCFFM
ncbi:hypothetical protein Tco_0652071 [Tanacetum coccineum]|uniref:Uncharacterized protein n=1 Tax=Tanacetum coccineum TaxID=301880 RepID=A0ABQ4WWJ9_9ASTR